MGKRDGAPIRKLDSAAAAGTSDLTMLLHASRTRRDARCVGTSGKTTSAMTRRV